MQSKSFFVSLLLVITPLLSGYAFAMSETAGNDTMVGASTSFGGILCLVIFVISYLAVLTEEYTHLAKSKPVMLGAGLIWMIIGMIAPQYGAGHHEMRVAIFHGLDEYGGLLLFLLAAMTYISAMEDRNVFAVLRAKMIQAGLNLKQLFWATGVLAFILSPVADNLTTALVLGAVVLAVGQHEKKFVAISCINIVNAANAGGAFSPFGDITTLMVWQAEKVEFFEFFALFLPSLVCFIIPAFFMHFFISDDRPEPLKKTVSLKTGAKTIMFLGVCTIAMAVSFEQMLGLPPFIGMMTGLSLLMITAWSIRHRAKSEDSKDFDILKNVARAEWDTLLFFFGVIFSVGGLGFLGYLDYLSTFLYEGYGASTTNIILGFVSAIIDNIPVMFAVLSMDPEMNHFDWLLMTLTAGIGGSLLSIGSAAGVALMGTARGQYTFFEHLKWTPILLLGYAGGIATHFWVNG